MTTCQASRNYDPPNPTMVQLPPRHEAAALPRLRAGEEADAEAVGGAEDQQPHSGEGNETMKQPIHSEHWLDSDGRPQGGITQARGLLISWQNGPLGRGDERREPNGAFVETVIAAVLDRIGFYNDAGFACDENEEAIDHLNMALDALNRRTARREAAGVEGTHEGS